MATTKSAGRSTAPRTASVAAHSHKELEAKVVSLEGQLASALAAVAALEARVSACENAPAPEAAASGVDLELRDQLRKYFASAQNHKIPTYMPTV